MLNFIMIGCPGMVRPCNSCGVAPFISDSPAAGLVVTLGEARGWGLSSVSSQQEVVMHQVSALGASQGVF